MSGGRFEYKQYDIDYIASEIEEYVYGIELEDDYALEDYLKEREWLTDNEKSWVREHKRTLPNIGDYDEETITLMIEAIRKLKEAAIYAQRIDWLLSGDDGEDSFKKRLKKDLLKLKTENNDTIRSTEE